MHDMPIQNEDEFKDYNLGTLDGLNIKSEGFVIVGGGAFTQTILTSSDGITWTSRTSGTSYYLRDITFGNNTFVTVGFLGQYGTILT